MFDPLALGGMGVVVGALVRLADAIADWMTLRGRVALVRAAGSLPPGTMLRGTGRDGGEWVVRVAGTQTGHER